jgi:hypothetical protein
MSERTKASVTLSVMRRAAFGVLCGGWLMQSNCLGAIQREFEVLLAPQSNPALLRHSILLELFGPSILQLFN